jgi:hypothetical protein
MSHSFSELLDLKKEMGLKRFKNKFKKIKKMNFENKMNSNQVNHESESEDEFNLKKINHLNESNTDTDIDTGDDIGDGDDIDTGDENTNNTDDENTNNTDDEDNINPIQKIKKRGRNEPVEISSKKSISRKRIVVDPIESGKKVSIK